MLPVSLNDTNNFLNKMTPQLEEINQLYTQSLRTYGVSPKSLGWKTQESQILRFDKLIQCFEIEHISKCIINDYGCGFGSMFPYLDTKFGSCLTAYYGYDINVEMLDVAKKLCASSKADWINNSDLSTIGTFSFVSGTFNVKFNASNDQWRNWIEQKLISLANHSTHGFAFNLLSIYVDWKQETLYYGDPMEFVDFCIKNISKKVCLLHDYPLYEWTIAVKM